MPRKVPVDYKSFKKREDVFCAAGIPYCHKMQRSLGKDERARLAELGVHLKNGAFTPPENCQLKRNWMSFAEQNQIALHICENFVSGVRHLSREEIVMRKEFWPHLGRGLEQRTGKQIALRATTLLTRERCPEFFDNDKVPIPTKTRASVSTVEANLVRGCERLGRRANGFTAEMDAALLHAAARKEKNKKLTWADVGKRIGVSGPTASKRYWKLTHPTKTHFPRDRWQQVVDAVVFLLPDGRQLSEQRQLWRVQPEAIDWKAVAEAVDQDKQYNASQFLKLWSINESFRRTCLHEPSFPLDKSQSTLLQKVLGLVHLKCIRKQRHEFDMEIDFSAVQRWACRQFAFMRIRQHEHYYSDKWLHLKKNYFQRHRNPDFTGTVTLPKKLKFIRRHLQQHIVRLFTSRNMAQTVGCRAAELETLDLAGCQKMVKRRLKIDADWAKFRKLL